VAQGAGLRGHVAGHPAERDPRILRQRRPYPANTRAARPPHLTAPLREAANGRHVVDRDLAGVLASPDGVESAPLSERELEVLGLLAKGMTNKEIASALFISRATVKSHIENILRKLEASDRAGAVAEGFRRRLLLS